MDNNKFDNIIKGKLESLSSDSAPRWDLFKEKLQAQDLRRADRDFDNTIRKNVSEYTVDYNPNHWTLLKSRLERIYAIRKSVFTAKSYEIIAILLLTFGVSTHYEFLFNSTTTPIAQINQEFNTNTNTIKSYNDVAIATEMNSQIAESNVEVIATSNNNNQVNSNQVSNASTYVITDHSEANNNINTSQLLAENSSPSITNDINRTVDNSRTTSKEVISTTEAISNPSIVSENSLGNISIASLSSLTNKPVSGFADRDVITIDDSRFGITPVVIPVAKSFVHIVASFDNNVISTPYNEQYNSRGPSETEMFGFTVSGLFSIQKGKWEYETGFGYSIYNKPANVPEYWDDNAGGVYKYTLNNVNYNILSAPLRLKYHFVTNPDWSLFVSGGLSPEFIVNTGYEETNEELNIQAPTPIDPEPGTPIYEQGPFRRNSNFHSGLFQNGSLSDNFMLRAHAGFGMQRNITPTLSAYFSGQLYRSVLAKTYGPTDDTINKFSISFGLRERF